MCIFVYKLMYLSMCLNVCTCVYMCLCVCTNGRKPVSAAILVWTLDPRPSLHPLPTPHSCPDTPSSCLPTSPQKPQMEPTTAAHVTSPPPRPPNHSSGGLEPEPGRNQRDCFLRCQEHITSAREEPGHAEGRYATSRGSGMCRERDVSAPAADPPRKGPWEILGAR